MSLEKGVNSRKFMNIFSIKRRWKELSDQKSSFHLSAVSVTHGQPQTENTKLKIPEINGSFWAVW